MSDALTATEAAGVVPAFLSIWSALGGWWVVVLYIIHRGFGVADKHGLEWLKEWIVSRQKIKNLEQHQVTCDERVAHLEEQQQKLIDQVFERGLQERRTLPQVAIPGGVRRTDPPAVEPDPL